MAIPYMPQFPGILSGFQAQPPVGGSQTLLGGAMDESLRKRLLWEALGAFSSGLLANPLQPATALGQGFAGAQQVIGQGRQRAEDVAFRNQQAEQQRQQQQFYQTLATQDRERAERTRQERAAAEVQAAGEEKERLAQLQAAAAQILPSLPPEQQAILAPLVQAGGADPKMLAGLALEAQEPAGPPYRGGLITGGDGSVYAFNEQTGQLENVGAIPGAGGEPPPSPGADAGVPPEDVAKLSASLLKMMQDKDEDGKKIWRFPGGPGGAMVATDNPMIALQAADQMARERLGAQAGQPEPGGEGRRAPAELGKGPAPESAQIPEDLRRLVTLAAKRERRPVRAMIQEVRELIAEFGLEAVRERLIATYGQP